MAHHRLTGMQSPRHPFYGDLQGPGDLIDMDSPMQAQEALAESQVYEALAQVEQQTASQNKLTQFIRPFIEGFTAGLTVYLISKAFGVDSKKAFQVSLVTGGLNVATGIASDYLYREMEAVQPLTASLQATQKAQSQLPSNSDYNY